MQLDLKTNVSKMLSKRKGTSYNTRLLELSPWVRDHIWTEISGLSSVQTDAAPKQGHEQRRYLTYLEGEQFWPFQKTAMEFTVLIFRLYFYFDVYLQLNLWTFYLIWKLFIKWTLKLFLEWNLLNFLNWFFHF